MGFSAKKTIAKLLSQVSGDKTTDQEAQGGGVFGRSDEALMAAYQQGDAQAFQILLSRHQKPIFGYLYRFLKNHEAAEEAFQEVFLRVVKARDDYSPSAKFTTWLYTLARHYCIDQIRKKKYHDHASFEDENEKSRSDPASIRAFSAAAEADGLSSAHELNSKLESLLTEMNPEQKEVFVLRELQELPFEDIAKVTGVSVNTVKSRMRYGLQFLQRKFKELGIDSPR